MYSVCMSYEDVRSGTHGFVKKVRGERGWGKAHTRNMRFDV